MKTAWEGKPKWLECVDGARQKHRGSITVGWKQEKVRPSRECFFLTSQSIELSTGLGNPAKNTDAGFQHFHRAGDRFISTVTKKNEAQTQLGLTVHGHLKHHQDASVASLRS
jgi:hypothetical protein